MSMSHLVANRFDLGQMRLLLNANSRKQVTRYVLTSLGGYIFSVAGINLTTQQFGVNKSLSYALIYALLYTIDYVITCRWVFAVASSSSRIRKYLVFLGLSWLVGTLTFALIASILPRVSMAVLVNLGVLFPIRFAVSKFWLYKPLRGDEPTERKI